MWSPLLRRHLFWPPSMVDISLSNAHSYTDDNGVISYFGKSDNPPELAHQPTKFPLQTTFPPQLTIEHSIQLIRHTPILTSTYLFFWSWHNTAANQSCFVSSRSPQAGRVKLRYFPNLKVDVDHTGRMAMFGYGLVLPETDKQKFASGPDDVIIVEGEWKRFTRNLINDLAKGKQPWL